MTSVQVNIRTTPFLANELDHIVQDGYFRSRSEALNEAIRLLIRRYKLAKLESKLASVREGTENVGFPINTMRMARPFTVLFLWKTVLVFLLFDDLLVSEDGSYTVEIEVVKDSQSSLHHSDDQFRAGELVP